MNLFEYEGKTILSKYHIPVPKGAVFGFANEAALAVSSYPVMVKAQVASGGRGKAGAVKSASNELELKETINSILRLKFGKEIVKSVLVEELLPIEKEYYLSAIYDTKSRAPAILFSPEGGMDIEETKSLLLAVYDLTDFYGSLERVSEKILPLVPEKQRFALKNVIKALMNAFMESDARQIEINPLVITKDGRFVAADAKVTLDEDATFRHEEWTFLEERNLLGLPPTERERAARKIDSGALAYRGTASKYIEMDGDIGVLFSGGGASITNMDALIKEGGKPANYTEYSGNPAREKVAALARVVMSKPGLKGLWICGGVANFTQIDETLGGIVDALREVKPKYPIVVRRAGPGEKEGQRIMEEAAENLGLTLKFFGAETPMGDTAKILINLTHGHTA